MSDHTGMVMCVIKTFLVQFCVFLPPFFFLISSASVLYGAYLCIKFSLGISNFVKRSRLSHSIVFLFFCIVNNAKYSVKKAFLSLVGILWNSAFRLVYLLFSPLTFASLLFSAICKASSDNHIALLHFF